MSKDLQDILLLLTSTSETLFNEDVLPCVVAAPKRESCCEAEAKRKVPGGYGERRSFDKYDLSRLCCGCQAYWHTAMARNALSTYIALQAKYGGKK